jgi:hypothetical protein
MSILDPRSNQRSPMSILDPRCDLRSAIADVILDLNY